MAELKTYDAKRINITIGAHTVKGYAEDSFISIEPDGDGTAATAGADGEVARALSNNPLHTITLTLQQTSDSNDYLSDLLARDRASGGAGVVPFQMVDLRGTTVVAAAQCWVVNRPTVENGSGVNNREWTLAAVINDNDFHVGGNQA